MNPNIDLVQKQIKAFNRRYERNEKLIYGDVYESIEGLIDVDRMTKSGYAKAGTKFLESLSPEELLAYSADIERANEYISFEQTFFDFEYNRNVPDEDQLKSMLWSFYNKVRDAGKDLPSEQVRQAELGNIDYRLLMLEANNFLTNPSYGRADFEEAWAKREGLGMI